MPESDMALPTLPDISLHPGLKMSIKNRKWKRKWKYLLNDMRWQSDFNGYLYIFDHARLRHGTTDTARRRPTSGTQNVDQKPEVETGSGNKF
jgi:hypothetical protein